MGGVGSGTWWLFDAKPTESDYYRVSITDIKKRGVLVPNTSHSDRLRWMRGDKEVSSFRYVTQLGATSGQMRVIYSNLQSGESYDYLIQLATTEPHYGGLRWWFQCPVKGCGKRVGVLYLADIFACRHCLNLAYTSQREQPWQRMITKAQKLSYQLGGEGHVDWVPAKPKGMHWKTYERKTSEMEQLVEYSTVAMMARFSLLGEDMERWL